ncbi:solute carrier organic anion transporter family member 1A6 isoform X1 [Drosophila sulfurigaster albostrigata]|uniref:solute carrier organic anion transporter family member 1A6 isoform X1 n=2 Tax=Drosophila sulfurigaster albostrigata TaxID=89887 RepID=UPI002D21CBCB|nr:solute carrier organic anion transporter family member 1A6 isoform X1 [Drosophila sulfurigaster albostrigata]
MAQNTRNSDMSQIAVNANNIPDDSVDCGIIGLGWCRGPACQKYARLRTFIIVLLSSGLLQGACELYFRVSAKQAAFQYGYNPLLVDWLLVSSGLFQAVFALAFAYWADVYHPIKWLVGTLMLQSVTCVIAVIPSIMNFADGVKAQDALVDANLCSTSLAQFQKLTLTEEQSSTLTLAMLFVLQLALGMGSLAYYTLGVSYIDDNSLSQDSPAVIGVILAARAFGQQIGSFLVLGVGLTNVGWWLGWIILAPCIFVGAVLLGLFPKRLPKTVIHQAAQRIMEQTNLRGFGSQFSTYMDDTNFWPSLKRLFSNRLLMVNLMSIMFLQSGVLNYTLQEESYLQSRFFLPYNEQDGLAQEWRASFVSFFLRPPVMAMGMIVAGLIISKAQLSARTITGINISLGLKLVAIFVAYIFISCDVGPVAGVVGGKLTQPYCASQCLCTPTAFMPVCPENSTVTYFSPCYAGCTQKSTINSFSLYEGCSCMGDQTTNVAGTSRATAGACSAAACQSKIIIFQVLSISAAFMVGMSAIGKTLITLRAVLPQDKTLALGFELMLVGLFAYVPAHLSYDLVTRTTCVYWAPNYERCLLRETPKHGNILDILTASLILVAVFFDVLVFIFAKGLNLYNCKVTDNNYTPSLYAPVPHEDTPSHSAPVSTMARDGSPETATTAASNSPMQRRDAPQALELRPEATVFRHPSSLTDSSGAQSIVEPNGSGVTYAQVVFPPDKRKPVDGSTSPKRLAVPANVPLHHLSETDVRTQLGTLKSFNPAQPHVEQAESPGHDVPGNVNIVSPQPKATAATTAAANQPEELDFRPQSPETDF